MTEISRIIERINTSITTIESEIARIDIKLKSASSGEGDKIKSQLDSIINDLEMVIEQGNKEQGNK